MEYICPLCNGLKEYDKRCKRCSTIMKDGGRVQDYYDDYSPYLSYNVTDVMDDEPANICQHIFTCPECRYDEMANINKIVN